MNLFISSLLSGATLLLAELVGSRWSPSTDKAVCITASFSMSSIMPGLLPRANQERSWQVREDQLGEHLSWYGLQLPETKHQQPKHSIWLRLHHALWKNSLLHPGRAGNHHSHSWWDGGNRTEAGNVRHRHPEDQQDLWMLKIRKINSNDGLCFLVF